MSVERGCGPEADIDPRELVLRAVTVVAWHATVICERSAETMDAHAPR